MNLREFNALVGSDSYVLCKGKVRIDKELVDVDTAERHLMRDGNTVGWWVRSGFVVVDIDEGKEQAKEMIKRLGIKTLVAETNKGLHLYFSTDKEVKQGQGMTLPSGLKCDTRSANKGYVLLPFGVQGRRFNNIRDIAPLPLELTPIDYKKDSLFNLSEGDGRNAKLFSQLMAYKNAGATEEQLELMADTINQVIFKEPMEDKELRKILNNVHSYDPADDRNPYLHYNDKGNPNGVNDAAIRDYFIGKGDLFVLGGQIYRYENGIYAEDTLGVRETIEELINTPRFVTDAYLTKCVNLILKTKKLQKDSSELNPDKNLINFKNGVWNIETQELLPHDSKYYQTIQVPHELMKADKPWEKTRIYKYLSEYCKLLDEDIEMIANFMAYCLTLRQFKGFMALYGPSNTGKSVLIKFIENLVGKNNTSALSMADFNRKFYPTELYDRLLNSSADDSTTALSDVSILKRITGGDKIMHEEKGMKPFFFEAFAKLIFSFNQLPLQLEDTSDAYYKRMRVLHMDTVLDLPKGFVDELWSDFATKEALPHLLDRLPMEDIESTPKSDRLVDALRRDSDTVYAFLSEKCRTGKEEYWIESNVLFTAYIKYCSESGRRGYGKQEFNRQLEGHGYERKRNTKIQPKKPYGWKGITLKGKR